MAVHLSPRKLKVAMKSTDTTVAELALQAGLRQSVLDEVVAGSRRVGSGGMRLLASALGTEWAALRCGQKSGSPCGACEARNPVDVDARDEIAALLSRLMSDAVVSPPAASDDLDSLQAYEAVVRAITREGGNADPALLFAATQQPNPDQLKDLAVAAVGWDVPTEELVALDCDFGLSAPVRVAGWTLRRLSEADLASYAPLPGMKARRELDSVAATRTWWLSRRIDEHPALGSTSNLFADPEPAAVTPRFAIALVTSLPIAALNYVLAQPGRGIFPSLSGTDVDYVIEDDGYVSVQFGPARPHAVSDTWPQVVACVGEVAESVLGLPGCRRLHDAAEQFLAVGAELLRGFAPHPRLPLDLSTVLELLLLDAPGADDVSRRVQMSAAWLGGANDVDRDEIFDLTRQIYRAGSAYRHGGSRVELSRGRIYPPKGLDVFKAYWLLQRLMLHGLAVAHAGYAIGPLCDGAQRRERDRIDLRRALDGFYGRVGMELRPMSSWGPTGLA